MIPNDFINEKSIYDDNQNQLSVAERLFLDQFARSKMMQTKQYLAVSCQNSLKELDRSIHHGARVRLLPLRKLPTKHLRWIGISTN